MNPMHKKQQISYQNNLTFRITFFIFKELTEPESRYLEYLLQLPYGLLCVSVCSESLTLKIPDLYTKP
jgi:hypothetical protein